jgi:hypothetical protein
MGMSGRPSRKPSDDYLAIIRRKAHRRCFAGVAGGSPPIGEQEAALHGRANDHEADRHEKASNNFTTFL